MEGRLDMAVDEALATAVGDGRSIPVARLYGFSPPTLSLGRFQRVKGKLSLDALARDGITLVRRPTGGHAVLHDRELTYSVMLPRDPQGARKREIYLFIARILLAGLARLGVQGRVNAAQQGDAHNPDCFGSAGEYEIAGPDGRKLIGSAQMTTRRAVLQHGSIPLENPGGRVFRYLHAEPALDSHEPTCLDELAGRPLGFEEVQDAFARAFRECVAVEESILTAEESDAAQAILNDKYASDSWNLAH
jgi:lipoate-protein ligase A